MYSGQHSPKLRGHAGGRGRVSHPLPKCSSDQAAELIARIRRRLAARSDGILTLDVAFGSYTAQDDSLTFDQVFHRADRAMYENKKEMHRTQVQ